MDFDTVSPALKNLCSVGMFKPAVDQVTDSGIQRGTLSFSSAKLLHRGSEGEK